MKQLYIIAIVFSILIISGCESLYYSLALDKSVMDGKDKAKFDRDVPDMMERVDKY